MNRAAIYARVSDKRKQGDNYSLPSQMEHCHAYAKEHGYTVTAEYREAFTGTERQRTKLDELREAAQRGDYDVVITINSDRLSRGGLVDQLLIEDEFRRYGAPFEYVFEPFEDTPEGRFQKDVRAILAQFEHAKIIQRTKWGREQYIKAGHVVRGRVDKYGYRYANKAEGKSNFEIVPDEAVIVGLIYQWYTLGDETGQKLGQWEIAKKLTSMGVPTRYDKDVKEIERSHKKRPAGNWPSIVVSRILSDETYAGTHWHGKHRRTKDEKTGKHHFLKTPSSEWVAVPVPAIVSRELWEAARRQAGLNETNSSRNAKYPFLLRGFMRCSRCNGGFYGSHHHGKPVYRCKGTYPEKWAASNAKLCKGDLPGVPVETLVWDIVKAVVKNPELITLTYQERQAQFKPQIEALTARLEDVMGNIVRIEGTRARLIDLYLMENSTLSKDILGERDAALKAQLDEFLAQKATLEAQLNSTEIPENALREVLKACERLREGIDEFDYNDKRYTMELLDVSLLVQRGETRDQDTLLIMGYFPTKSVILSGEIAEQSII